MVLCEYWHLSPEEQAAIRVANPGYADGEKEYQEFLEALFPSFNSFQEADEVLNVSDTQTADWLG